MDTLYQKLNKKLDRLGKQHQTTHHNNENTNTTPRLINLTNITFTREQTHALIMGPNYALEKDPKKYVNELIIDTENAIRQLEPKIQNTFRHMASRKINQILTTNTYRPMHKRHQNNINQIKNTLQRNNLTIARADKNKAIVIISKDALEQKIITFIQENQITRLNKDPTECFQKQIQQALQKCDALIGTSKHKYLMNIKPTAPHLNAYIKTHKEDRPIRPVINNIPAPLYKAAKLLNRKLQQLINLPNTYTAKNSHEVALDLHNTRTNQNHKLITLDIKDLYVNLTVQDIIQTTKFWLSKNSCDNIITEQTLHILEIIVKQNYFQHNGQYY
jgi:hypothetical protein